MTDDTNCPADVLIIGSGIGGLTTGIILAKLGYGVTIIEKNRLPGGLMRSYIKKGVDCPVGIHYMGSLDDGQPLRRMFDYLGISKDIPLVRMGSNGIIDRYIFDDFTFDLPEGIDAFAESLETTFPDDRLSVADIMKNIRNIAAMLQGLDFLYAPFNPLSVMEYLDSLGVSLTKRGCSAGLRSVLAVPPTWIGISLAECPILYHHMALVSYLLSAWRLQETGARMSEVISKRFRELGGCILTGDPVVNIQVEGRAVAGIKLKSGLILNSPVIIAAIHPKVVLEMLPEGAVKPSYRRRIMESEDTQGVFSASFLVDAESDIPYNIFRVKTTAEGDIAGGMFFQLKKSDTSGRKLLNILQTDEQEQWQSWEHTKSGQRGSEYLEAKEKKACRMLNAASEVLGSFQGVEHLDAYSPLTIRDWVNSPHGSAYGIRRSTRQLLKTATLGRPAIKGLYYAGQNVLMPGIMGTVFGSFHTVKQIIGDDTFRRHVIL